MTGVIKDPARKRVVVVARVIPKCPDCNAIMVKVRIEINAGEWISGWLCKCKYDGGQQ